MSADGFRPLADPRYFDDDLDRDVDQERTYGHEPSHDRPPAPGPSIPSPPGFFRVAGGLLLIAIGLEFLVERTTPVELELTTLVVGLLLLSWWARAACGWAYVAGAIVTGIGVGALLGGLVGGPVGALLSALATAGGFAVLATRPPHLRWAWIPAGIIAFFGVAGFGFALASAILSSSSGVLLPLSLVVAGCVLLGRHALPGRTRSALLIGCAVVFVLAASAQTRDTVGPLTLDGLFGERMRHTTTLEPLGDRTLIIDAGNDDVTLRSGGSAPVVTTRSSRAVEVPPPGELEVRVVLRRDATITVPIGSAVEIQTDGGQVDIEGYRWANTSELTITTVSGDIEADILGGPDVEVQTRSGEVEIDDEDYEDGFDGRVPGAGTGTLEITTVSGDIDVERTAAG